MESTTHNQASLFKYDAKYDTTQTTDADTSPNTPTQETARDVFWMANGSASATRAAYRHGAHVGFEAFNTPPPDEIPVDFVDFPFSKVETETRSPVEMFDEYLDVVRQNQPRMAVIPDINDDVDAEQAWELADRLEPHCETMVVAPKTIHPLDVPDSIRVGVPCQDKFSSNPWSPHDYRDCDELHLFGGSPHKHYELIYENGLTNVESVDTSVPVTSAQFGDTWVVRDETPQWTDGNGGVYGCVGTTFANMIRILNRDRPTPEHTERLWVERPDRGRYETCGTPDEDLIHPHEETPFEGREYYTRQTDTRHTTQRRQGVSTETDTDTQSPPTFSVERRGAQCLGD